MKHSSTSTPEKTGIRCTITNHYPHGVQVPITTRYQHGNRNQHSPTITKTVPPLGHTISHNRSHNCANTRAHLERVKPRLRSRTTTSGKARVGKERRHHTGTDYWLIRPVSNPDNTTQEQPLSLAVTDERSNCRSMRTSQTTVEANQHHTCRHTVASPCLAPLGSLAGAP
ncbi:hypothetical protein Taro_022105 [Colocasia esculenta]|uniref:Uncharacterized protein n=1 Tax=Colocasia esculenta TaxID=4460 RepID=A0A843VDI0_COLES|nr:hypothetical protein [Colocasia esculenta]